MTRFLNASLLILVLFGGHGIALAADLWIGTCHNVTASADGNLKLYVNERSGRITGFISISGWLVGSGEITGRKDGNRFEFESSDPVQGIPITWTGTLKDGRITGEYYIPAMPAFDTPRQVGEWSVALYVDSVETKVVNEDRFKKLFIFDLERDFNSPVTMNDGSRSTGTAILFDSVHPVGTPVATTVESVQITWLDDRQGFTRENLHKYRIELTLYWHGVIRTFGQTRMAVTYNAKLGEFTGQEVLSTNGVTKREVRNVAGAVGMMIAKSALDAFLADK